MAKKTSLTQKSKIERIARYDEWYSVYEGDVLLRITKSEITLAEAFENFFMPFLSEGDPTPIEYFDFYRWHKKMIKRYQRDEGKIEQGMTLLEREVKKKKQQIIVRQDAADLMATFVKTVKDLSSNPQALRASGVDVMKLYKIIREEEDRAIALQLRERAENRADAQFAFIVSVARTNQLLPEDIEFLEADLKQELQMFRQPDGNYKLPTSFELAANEPATADTGALAGQGY